MIVKMNNNYKIEVLISKIKIFKLNLFEYILLSERRKFQLFFFLNYDMSAFCEALSIASLLPFLSILTNPNNLEDITS